MRLPLIIFFLLVAQVSFSQLDVTSLTGFTFKQSKAEALAVAKSSGGQVPENLKEELSLGLKGMKLLGHPNSLVIINFYKDQLYNIGVFIDAKNAEEQQVHYESVMQQLKSKYGDPNIVKDTYTFWTMNPVNPDSDRIIVNRSTDFSLSIQLTNGELLNLSKKEK